MNTPLTDITECRLCGATFTGPRIAIVGRPDARIQALLESLGSHLNLKHPQQAQAMNINGAAYMGLLFMMHFKSTDAELNSQRDILRWQIHQMTLNARFSDESLKTLCDALALRLLDCPTRETARSILLEVFTGMRDVLEEPNRYAVSKPEQLVS